jgi:hypothetical protein
MLDEKIVFIAILFSIIVIFCNTTRILITNSRQKVAELDPRIFR